MGQIIGATGYIIEEKFLGDQESLDPLLIVGYEGIGGICIWSVLLPIFQHIPCDNKTLCVNGVVEDTVGVFEDYAANTSLILQSILLICVSGSSNATGVGITKYGSAAQRTTVGLAKNMLVWIVFMTIPIDYWDVANQ